MWLLQADLDCVKKDQYLWCAKILYFLDGVQEHKYILFVILLNSKIFSHFIVSNPSLFYYLIQILHLTELFEFVGTELEFSKLN